MRRRLATWLAAPDQPRTTDLALIGRGRPENLVRRALWRLRRKTIRVGGKRLTAPVDVHFGYSRGRPVDRIYLDAAMADQRDAIRGRVLEVGDSFTADTFGAAATSVDVLHVDPEAPGVTVVADLADAPEIADGSYDTLIVPQTLHLIYDFHAAIRTMHRILAPGGTALVTFPGITPLGDATWVEAWMWGFTSRSARRMFAAVFGEQNVTVEAFGNVTTAAAFVVGLSADDLRPADFEAYDPRYEILVCVRAVKQ